MREVIRVGCLNVRGVNEDMKKVEVGMMFQERKLDILGVTETKLKGKKEVEFGEFKGVVSGVNERVRAREGVGIVMRKEVWEKVREWRQVSSRVMWVRVKFGGERWVFICAYAPVNGAREEERERFWNELNECWESFRVNEKVCLLGDLNARVGREGVGRIIGPFGVGDRNENGESLIELCEERRMVVGNTWFKKSENHKYTWRSEITGGRALLDYVCVQGRDRGRLLDVNVLRGAGRGMSDHYLVEAKVRVGGEVVARERVSKNRVEVTRVEKLDGEECTREFKRRMEEKWWEVRERRIGEMEEEWKSFKEAVCEVARSVCGVKRVGEKRRKGSEWWNEELREVLKRKKEAYGKYLGNRCVERWEEYRGVRVEAKRAVDRAKRRAKGEWCRKVTEKYEEGSKMFWKEVNKKRKKKEGLGDRIKGEDGEWIGGEEKVRKRWGEYYNGLLNDTGRGIDEGEQVERIGGVGEGEGEEEIQMEELSRALKKGKRGKAAGLDDIKMEMLQKGGRAVEEWLLRLFNICWRGGEVPQDWEDGCVVPLYKGKGDRMECGNYRGICLLSVVGKVYGRILIERVRGMTEERIGEEQGGFRGGRGCVDQAFTLKMLVEKSLERRGKVYGCFLDLEKAYDRIKRGELWRVLEEYGIGGKLGEGIKAFYRNSRMCVRVGGGESEMFRVGRGLRQGCVMSPWLFNIFMDSVCRGMEREGRGVELVERNGRWEVNMILFADDTALLAKSAACLRDLVSEFERVCGEKGLKINPGKSKVLVFEGEEGEEGEVQEVRVGGEVLEKVEVFRYLGMDVGKEGGVKEEIDHRVGEGMRALSGLREIWKGGDLTRKIKTSMFEKVCVPAVLYGCETWGLNARARKKLEVFEMKGLRAVCGVSRRDRIRNREVRERCEWRNGLVSRAEKGMLRWFGHLERMEEQRVVRRVWEAEGVGGRGRGRPRRRWMDGVKEVLARGGMSVGEGRVLARDRLEWRRFVAER